MFGTRSNASRSLFAKYRARITGHCLLIFALVLCASSALAQTALFPSAGDGLTTATAYQITELGNLVWLQEQADADLTSGTYYRLMNDIDARATATWNDAGTTSDTLEGFQPIGTDSAPFLGVFDGGGHRIVGLTINRIDSDFVGLFGCIADGARARSLGLVGGSVTGRCNTGALAGRASACMIENCYAGASVSDHGAAGFGGSPIPAISVGGLIGYLSGGTVTRCYGAGTVDGYATPGDLWSWTGSGFPIFIWTSGYPCDAGGLIGSNSGGVLADCYATGRVTGHAAPGIVYDGYYGHKVWPGSPSYAGGLVGNNLAGTVATSYATGATVGITAAYTSATAEGLIALSAAGTTVTACYWDAETTSQTTSAGGTGKTTALMKQQSTFLGWDFANVWAIAPDVNQGYPYLRAVPPGDRPSKPVAPSPSDGATSQTRGVILRWQDGGGAESYDVYLGTANPPVTCVSTSQTAAAYAPASPLAHGTTYFWRVDAGNSEGTTTGDVWSFTTAPAPAAPGKASTPSPADGATSQSLDVALGWQDGGGAASYDVYFGTANPPVTCVSTSQTATGYAPDSPIAYATTYFWRVDAKNAVGTTPGDIWSFTTAPAPPDPVLSVTPAHRDVAAAACATSFTVANAGTGTMAWTAQVTSGTAWLAISSGANGTDAGTIHVSVAANSGGARTGTITVTATNASGGGAPVVHSPQSVTVTQAAAAPPVVGSFLGQRIKSAHAERWDAAGAQIDVKDAYSFSAKMQIPASSLASISNATTLTLVLGDDATSGAAHVLFECALAAATKSTLAGHPTARKPKDPARGGAVTFVALQAGSAKKARIVSLKWAKTGLLTVTVLGTPAPASWALASPAARRVSENVADLCSTQWPAGAAAGVAVPAFVQLHGVFADADTLTCAGKKKVTPSDGGDLVGWSVSGK